MKRQLVMALTAGALGTALLAPATVARPPAENMGCSQGSEWMVVGEGEADRLVPRLVDDPANGGNGDGIVCAHAFGDGRFHKYPERPDTVYGWDDNWR